MVTVGEHFDHLLDIAWDAGAKVVWGHRDVRRLGNQPRPEWWLNIQMPDRCIEQLGSTLEYAAWAILAKEWPSPDDRLEA